eukprot:g2814.t1
MNHHRLHFIRKRRQVLHLSTTSCDAPTAPIQSEHNRFINDFANLCFHDFSESKHLRYFSLKSQAVRRSFAFWTSCLIFATF